MASTSITFRCPKALYDAIERVGRANFPRTDENPTAKTDYDRTAALTAILNAGIAALEGEGVPTKQASDTVRQGVSQEAFEELREMVEGLNARLGKLRA